MKFIVLALGCISIASAVSVSVGDHVTTSGVSSGAYMAEQLHFIHSSWVKGAALFAGGPFYCSGGVAATALTLCMKDPALIVDATLKSLYVGLEASGSIDSLSNLKGSKVMIISGTKDS